MDTFCGSEFWNESLTWNTNDPDFTPCFEDTVFVWTPCLLLWLSSISDFYKIGLSTFSNFQASNRRKLRWTRLSVLKVVLALVAILVNFIRVLWHSETVLHSPVKWVNLLVHTTTLVLFIALVMMHRSHGIYTSGSIFTFWFLNFLFTAITLRTIVKLYMLSRKETFYVVVEAAYLFVVTIQVIIHCWSDYSPWEHAILQENDGLECPEVRASFVSKTLYSWVTPMTVLGYRQPLEHADVWSLRKRDKCDGVVRTYDAHWCHNVGINNITNRSVWTNIVVPLWAVVSSDYIKAQIYFFFATLTGFLMPQLLDRLIYFVEVPIEETWKGYFYATLMFLTAVINSILLNYFYLLQLQMSLNSQAALSPIVYRKVLNISNHAKKGFSVGELTNLMTVDVDKVREVMWYSTLPWSAPLQLVLALYFLYLELGPSAFVGLTVLVLLLPINWIIVRKLSHLQEAQMKNKDERVHLMNEILSGIKILKLYAWELSFKGQVQAVRSKEISNLRLQSYLDSLTELLYQSMPFLVSLATFAVYTAIDPANKLDSRKAFVSIALFNLLKIPIADLPRFISTVAKSRVSYERISKFFNAEENDPSAITWIKQMGDSEDNKKNTAVSVKNGQFSWGEDEPTLSNLNLSIPNGQLFAVVGEVASGKSSLLSSFLGEMKRLGGEICVLDSVAYVPQVAWIRNATLRDNIIFQTAYNDAKYNRVLDCCALRPDLEILPGGDATEIGEKGINLSGGQKQRVALARAAYSDAQLFLLDDPLSAVDVHVAQHLFENLIGPQGILGNKTRVMVTHSVTFLAQVDCIIVMKDGTVSECGTFKQLQENGGAFSEFLSQHSGKDDEENEDKAATKKTETVPGKMEAEGTTLIQAESVETGTVKFHVYWNYFKAIGWPTIVVILIFYALAQGFSVSTNVWLSIWVEDAKQNRTSEAERAAKDFFLEVYTALGVSQCLVFFIGALSVYIGSLVASQLLHNQMLLRIVHAPMAFFDTTPLGRIINRFGEDTEAMDQAVSWDYVEWISAFFQLIGIVGTICFTLPLFIAVILPATGIYFLISRYFAPTSRQLNRLITVLRSPLYSHLGETLAPSGTACIRAFRVQDRYIQGIQSRLNSYMASVFAMYLTRRWMAVRLEFLAGVLVFAASLFAVMSRSTLSAGLVGLSISYALQITNTLSWLTKVTSFLEPDMVCVERVLEYAQTVEQEANLEIPEKAPPPDWPQDGCIEFVNVNLRYRNGLDLVLKDVTFTINPREKVGVVGRTGAGKSSLTAALFRLVEIAEGGVISIDGVDIKQLGLHDVRRNITIIPQDPVIFSATFRINLDPFNEYSDEELWSALSHANLKEYVESLPEGLEYKLSAGGENLSVGQRQLLCIGRAILRKPRILVLDEATAAIDLDTDQLIQKTIRREFAQCTVLTIAHRINTIMDSSRILVMDGGQVKEFDTPRNLMATEDSIFKSMVVGAGLQGNLLLC